MQFFYTSTSSWSSLHQCYFAMGTPCYRSRSSCQFLISKIKFRLLLVLVFRMWNSTSHTSFVLLFSRTIPLSHFCWYQVASWSINFCCFAQATARIISALLCMVRYLLFSNLMHQATRYSTVSKCWLHILHLYLSGCLCKCLSAILFLFHHLLSSGIIYHRLIVSLTYISISVHVS